MSERPKSIDPRNLIHFGEFFLDYWNQPSLRSRLDDETFSNASKRYHEMQEKGEVPRSIYELNLNYSAWTARNVPYYTERWGIYELRLDIAEELLKIRAVSGLNPVEEEILKIVLWDKLEIASRVFDIKDIDKNPIKANEGALIELIDSMSEKEEILLGRQKEQYEESVNKLKERIKRRELLRKQGKIGSDNQDVWIIKYVMLGLLDQTDFEDYDRSTRISPSFSRIEALIDKLYGK